MIASPVSAVVVLGLEIVIISRDVSLGPKVVGPTWVGVKVLLTEGAIQVAVLLTLPVPLNEPVTPEVWLV